MKIDLHEACGIRTYDIDLYRSTHSVRLVAQLVLKKTTRTVLGDILLKLT